MTNNDLLHTDAKAVRIGETPYQRLERVIADAEATLAEVATLQYRNKQLKEALGVLMKNMKVNEDGKVEVSLTEVEAELIEKVAWLL